MKDELDEIVFKCCKCGKDFDVTQGTWLPIGMENKTKMITEGEYPKVLSYGEFLKPPEVITSDEFTCYDCAP